MFSDVVNVVETKLVGECDRNELCKVNCFKCSPVKDALPEDGDLDRYGGCYIWMGEIPSPTLGCISLVCGGHHAIAAQFLWGFWCYSTSWPIWRVLYLDGWNSIPHSRLHLPGVWRSSCNCCSVSVGFLVLQYMYLVVSSAKKLIFDNIPSEMSLMKMRNRMVQRTDPVGAKMSRTHFGGHYFQHNPLGMISPWVWSPLSTSESCLPCHAQLVKEAVVGTLSNWIMRC